MGNRLSKIVTKTGDKGETGLADGSRIAKSHDRIEAIGAIDETLSALGLTISQIQLDANKSNDQPTCLRIAEMLQEVQHRLFDLGGELAWPAGQAIQQADIAQLELFLTELNTDLPALKNFILPGGNMMAAQCHMARSLCRRAERQLVRLTGLLSANEDKEEHNEFDKPLRDVLLQYINRLSDLLFIAARQLARKGGGEEILWQQQNRPRKNNT